MAVMMARSPLRRRALKAKLEQNRLRMPLFDTERFTRHLETAFEMMVARAARGCARSPSTCRPCRRVRALSPDPFGTVHAMKNPGAARRRGFSCLTGQCRQAFVRLLNRPLRLSNSSTFTPWRFMMIACWMIDSVLFQAQ